MITIIEDVYRMVNLDKLELGILFLSVIAGVSGGSYIGEFFGDELIRLIAIFFATIVSYFIIEYITGYFRIHDRFG
ncbi:MAG: hypothetical protein U9N40_07500 [Euryarchaeota archaeon]|nr:hypothetical protein [Euryarchaeota archaeon]